VSVVHTEGGEVGVMVTHSHWDNTKAVLERVWDENQKLTLCPVNDVEAVGEYPGLNQKQLERDHGYLIYADQTYPAIVPYLKRIHPTFDSWRPGINYY
jgi:hypothetical protein